MIDAKDLRRFERQIDAMAKAAGDDPAGIAQALDLMTRFQLSLRTYVIALLDKGYSWGDIANELGVTKQAAHQRFRRGVS